MIIIVYILIFLFLVTLLGFVFAATSETQKKSSVFGGLEMTLFLVMMPKNDLKKKELMQKEEKNMISEMEQVLSNFLYLKKPRLFQPRPVCALEIASQLGSSDISFYMAVPTFLENVFSKYVQGIYPLAIVDKIPEDYTVFEPNGATAAAYLKLRENYLFPISTYKNLEKDPLASLTNNLSKISANEGAAIQLIIRPLSESGFRTTGEKALKKMREGKPARVALAETFQSPLIEFFSEMLKGPENTKKNHDVNQKNKETHFDQKEYDVIQSKIQKQAFETNIRLVASSKTQARAEEILNHLIGSFSQFSLLAVNSFEPKNVYGRELKNLVFDFSFRTFSQRQSNILNLEEIASIYHFPTEFIETPYIKAVKSGVAAPPADLPENGINLIGKVMFRGEEKNVYFASKDDRRRHFYIIGQTGVGKSALLREMIRQDIENGEGVGVVDPHGELIEYTLANIPSDRVEDVVLFEPYDQDRPMGLNMLEYDSSEQKDFAVQEMIAIFYKLFPPEIIGPMFEHYMRNAM
ncbi:MAG: DUF87 domain-containing protein, partial [Candidatus Staskawiczbacteria bacterium]|nr:DUF87 domain-containing protein [Candidatus Staskawiczbacteria bacterium]